MKIAENRIVAQEVVTPRYYPDIPLQTTTLQNTKLHRANCNRANRMWSDAARAVSWPAQAGFVAQP
jgi:hypothetical protein